MQYYTRQQLQGSIRFDPSTLIGNWDEDRQLQEAVVKDFVAKHDAGTLKISGFQKRMEMALKPVEMTKISDDDYVHFGDIVQLAHVDTGAVLSTDPRDRDSRPGEQACAATASPEFKSPCARNTMVLAKFKAAAGDGQETEWEGDVLRYGQKVRLLTNPEAFGQPLDSEGGPQPRSLFSKPVSATHYAKYSRHQVVGATARREYDSVWYVLPPDPRQWLACRGVEVLSSAPLCVVHAATGSLLAVESATYPNEFGNEMEVSCHRQQSLKKQNISTHSAKGEYSATLPKPLAGENVWTILNGSRVAALPQPCSNAEAVQSLLGSIASQAGCPEGLAALQQRMLRLDADGSGAVDLQELHLLLRSCGVLSLAEAELELLATSYSSDKTGCVNVRSFLAALDACAAAASG